MRHANGTDFQFDKELNLIYEDKPFMGLVESKDYPKEYFVRYPDGVLSAWFYNISMAKQHCRDEAVRIKTEEYHLECQV